MHFLTGTHTAIKIADMMGFNRDNSHFNIISGNKDNNNDTEMLYIFNLT